MRFTWEDKPQVQMETNQDENLDEMTPEQRIKYLREFWENVDSKRGETNS